MNFLYTYSPTSLQDQRSLHAGSKKERKTGKRPRTRVSEKAGPNATTSQSVSKTKTSFTSSVLPCYFGLDRPCII